jgi:hypothetical protein
MKRALEAVLVLATLALGVFVVHQALARRDLAARRPNPALAPAADAEDPGYSPSTPPGGVQGLPMVKLTHPAKPARRETAVPPPPAAAP